MKSDPEAAPQRQAAAEGCCALAIESCQETRVQGPWLLTRILAPILCVPVTACGSYLAALSSLQSFAVAHLHNHAAVDLRSLRWGRTYTITPANEYLLEYHGASHTKPIKISSAPIFHTSLCERDAFAIVQFALFEALLMTAVMTV